MDRKLTVAEACDFFRDFIYNKMNEKEKAGILIDRLEVEEILEDLIAVVNSNE